MMDFTRDEIRKVVKEVLAGVLGKPEPASEERASYTNGPRVMIVYHAGTGKMDEVENQVREIGWMAGKSGVYTTMPAREVICAPAASDRPPTQCRLDTVSREGLDQVLGRADVLVLPTFCLVVAAKVARLDFNDEDAGFVLSALVRGKKVLAANDGFLVLQILRNEGLRAEFDRILSKIQRFGMVLCPTVNLAAEFSKLIAGRDSQSVTKPKFQASDQTAHDLVTANVIRQAVNNKSNEVLVTARGIVTPLARDLARDYDIRIVTRGE